MPRNKAGQGPQNPVKGPDEVPKHIPRDRWDRPLIRRLDNPEIHEPYTRASTFGSYLESEFNLGRWRQGVIAFGMGRDRGLQIEAGLVGSIDDPDDKTKLYDIADRAFARADGDQAARLGTAVHALTDKFDRGHDMPPLGPNEDAMRAYAQTIGMFEVVMIETFVVNDHWNAAGTFDRLLRPRWPMQPVDRDGRPFCRPLTPDDLIIGDLKTASTADFFGLKFAVQEAVYDGGSRYDPDTGARTPLGANGLAGVIIHMPPAGNAADLYWVDLAQGREAGDLAAQVRAIRSRSKHMIGRHREPVGVQHGDSVVVEGNVITNDGPVGITAGVSTNGARPEPDGVGYIWAELYRADMTRAQARRLWSRNREHWTAEHSKYAAGLPDAPESAAS